MVHERKRYMELQSHKLKGYSRLSMYLRAVVESNDS